MIIKLDPANAFSTADEPGNFTTGQNGRAMFPGVEHVGCRKAKRVDGAIGDLNGAEQSRIHGRLNTQRFRWRQLAGLDTGLLTGADKGLLPGQVVLGKGDKQSVSGLNTVAGDAAQDAVFTDAFPGRFAIGYGIARAAVQQPPCSAATIIAELGIPKSTVYLLLGELKKQRFISMDNQDNYCLWTKLVELAGQALSKMDLRELARPRLTRLMDECGLLCHLGIIDQGNAYYILKIESPATISVRSHEGKSLSLYRSGIGKCLLAWQPASVQASIIEDLQWERATPTTITDAQQLREELGRIRARGWSFDNGEDYPDVRCVAAPVFNANNDLTAAISVVGTRLQINEDNRDYLAGKAIACAKDISRLLGWKSPFEQLASS